MVVASIGCKISYIEEDLSHGGGGIWLIMSKPDLRANKLIFHIYFLVSLLTKTVQWLCHCTAKQIYSHFQPQDSTRSKQVSEIKIKQEMTYIVTNANMHSLIY